MSSDVTLRAIIAVMHDKPQVLSGRLVHHFGHLLHRNIHISYHSTFAFVVSEQEVSKLIEKLKPYAHKWRDIAQGLGFTSPELKNIESSVHLVMGGPGGYLVTMLEEWQQWAPGDARGSSDYATLDSLKSAVNKARLGKLANEL